jgi:hypothetical protein
MLRQKIEQTDSIEVGAIKMEFHQANQDIKVLPLDKKNYYGNYYLHHLPQGRERVSEYCRLIYSELFDGIDLMWYGNDVGWKLYYIIKQASDPEDISFSFYGAMGLTVDENGDLVIETALNYVDFPLGEAYQINDSGGKIPMNWEPEYNIADFTVSFNIGSYDDTKPLVIEIKHGPDSEPVKSGNNIWCTYLGGSLNDYMLGTGIDPNIGNYQRYWISGTAESLLLADPYQPETPHPITWWIGYCIILLS